MRIAVLTTQTPHHCWYIHQLMLHYSNLIVVLETTNLKPIFHAEHVFEKQRDTYETESFLSDRERFIKNLCPVYETDNINNPGAYDFLSNMEPDILIVFGTRKINGPLISRYSGRILNLHGGDPEYYRGLDSHLWAIYHDDWKCIVSTIHILNEKIDDGNIIQKSVLDLSKIGNLHQLRAINTEACWRLTLGALNTYELFNEFITSKQQIKGRYYSFMPTDLKEICRKKFENYIKNL